MAETSSSGIKEPPVAYTRVGDARAAGARPAVPVRSHLGVGTEQSVANHRGEMQKHIACPSRAPQGVGPAQAVPGVFSIGSDSDAVSVASSSSNVELLRARADHAQAKLDSSEAEASSS
jgi:hypothetical protein